MVLTAPATPLREGGFVRDAMAVRGIEPPNASTDATKESVSRVRVRRRPPTPPTVSRTTDPGSLAVERPTLARTVDRSALAREIPISTNALEAPLVMPRREGLVASGAKGPAGESSPEGVTESPSRTPPPQPDSLQTGANADDQVSAGQPKLDRSHELSQPAINVSDVQIWRKPDVTAGASLAPRTTGIEGQVSEPAAETQKPAGSVALPLAMDLPTLQRQHAGEEVGDQPKAGQSARATDSQPLAVTPEIPAPASDAPPHMIWRKSATNPLSSGGALARARSPSTPLPLKIEATPANVPTLARAITIEGSMGSLAPETPVSEPVRGIDIGQLAEQVGRILSRTLEVERERRGMK